jgi:hypothetical protein
MGVFLGAVSWDGGRTYGSYHQPLLQEREEGLDLPHTAVSGFLWEQSWTSWQRVTKRLDTWQSASLEGLISPTVCRVRQHLPQSSYLVFQPGYSLRGQGPDPYFDPVELLSILGTFRLPPSNVEVLQNFPKAFGEFL